MKIYHWVSTHPNFGDDLNQFLWDFLMPEVVAKDDGALLVGVGTVLMEGLPIGRPRVVVGSGVGYKNIPKDLSSNDWRIYSVRGPLTAKLIGLPAEAAIIDPAALLPLMPDWEHVKSGDAIFIPHWETAHLPAWQNAAAAVGLRFVDPRQDARFVIQQIASASLVIAESMHAAIIADAFRVPWVPVIGTHRSYFKWNDWAQSLDLPYNPRMIGPTAQLLKWLVPPREFNGGLHYQSRFAKPLDLFERIVRRGARTTPAFVEQSLIVKGLRDAKSSMPFLSSDEKLALRQSQLLEKIKILRDDYASGLIVR